MTDYGILQTIDSSLTDIASRLCDGGLPTGTPRVSIVRWSTDSPDALPLLLASLDGQPSEHLSDRITGATLRRVPMRIRYADSCTLRLTFDSLTGDTFRALERIPGLPADFHDLLDGSTLYIDTDPETRLDADVATLVLVLQDMLIDDPGDMSHSITAIDIAAPFEHLREMEIHVDTPEEPSSEYIAWMAIAAESLIGPDQAVRSLFPDGAQPSVLFPFVAFPRQHGGSGADPEGEFEITVLLERADILFHDSGAGDTYPTIPLSMSALEAGGTEARDYVDTCLTTAWEATRTVAAARVRQRNLEARYREILADVIAPTGSILELLRRRSLLAMLKSLPDIPIIQVRTDKLRIMRDSGVDAYLIPDIPADVELPPVEAAPEEDVQSGEVAPVEDVATVEDVAVEDIPAEDAAPAEDVPRVIDEAVLSAVTRIAQFLDSDRWRESLGQRLTEIHAALESAGDSLNEVGGTERLIEILQTVDGAINGERLILNGEIRELETARAGYLTRLDAEQSDGMEDLGSAYERSESFWNQLVPLTLNGVSLKPPYRDIRDTLKKVRQEFCDYVDLTASDYREFRKCVDVKWPELACKYTPKLVAILDDTMQIWEISLSQALSDLETFRKKNVPDSDSIETGVSVQSFEKPRLPECLEVVVRRPGVAARLFGSADSESWRDETVAGIKSGAATALDEYFTVVSAWMERPRKALQDKIDRIEAHGREMVKMMEHDLESRKKGADIAAQRIEKELSACTARLQSGKEAAKVLQQLKSEWDSLHETFLQLQRGDT